MHGVSTRAVDELVQALGIGIGHLEVRGVPHLCRSRRVREGLRDAASRPHELPLRLSGRHLPPCARQPPRDLQGRGHRHGVTRRRAPRDLGLRRRGLRRRGLLAGLLRPRARRGLAVCVWSSPTSTPGSWRPSALPPGGGPPALPGALRPQPVGHGPQGPTGDGGSRLPHRLRLRAATRRSPPSTTRWPTSSPSASPRPPASCGRPRRRCWPSAAFPRAHWRQIWGHEPARAPEQGAQAAMPCGRHLPERSRRHRASAVPCSRHPRRVVGSRTPVLLRRLDGKALRRAR